MLEDNRPAYHPISRAVLEPGTELPTVPVDESWYIHKHRDTILDYTDLHDCEIQYIFAWDAHVLLRRILSPVYLPRIWLEFIEKNAEWLVSNPLLMEELGKHLSTLRGRGLLEDDGIVRNGLEILDAARRRLESEQEKDDSSATGPGEGGRGEVANTRDPGLVTPASHKAKLSKMRDDPYPVPPKPTSVSGCGVCLKPLRGPSVLICSNEVSTTDEGVFHFSATCRGWLTDDVTPTGLPETRIS